MSSNRYIPTKGTFIRLGKPGRRSPGLWGEENTTRPPPSPLRPWELSDAFLEGMSILQLYPVEAAGGIDRILQAASDMAQRRDEEMKAAKAEKVGLGARLKVSMWKGFTSQLSSALSDDEEDEGQTEGDAVHDDGNETETQQTLSPPGITTRLANTVWRGITNQTSMEVPPSPLTPLSSAPSSSNSPVVSPSPSPSPLPSVDVTEPSPSSSGPSIWGYAEKLKDSDAAASFAKVSTNWRAKAMNAWNARKKSTDNTELVSPTSTTSELPTSAVAWASWGNSPLSEPEDGRRDSLYRHNAYSPPPRPSYFRPPRDSFLPAPRDATISARSSPDTSPQSDSGLVHRTKASLASLAGLSPAPPPVPKQGPRPLMLSSSRISSPSPTYISRSASSTPAPYQGEWEFMRRKGHVLQKDSQSSISSLSPSDALGRSNWGGTRSDSDSGSTSRIVPINRRSVSPMAPPFRKPRDKHPFAGTSETSSDRDVAAAASQSQHASSESYSEKGWGRIELVDSPSVSSPSVPQTPVTFSSLQDGEVRVSSGGHERLGSIILNDSIPSPLERPSLSRKLVRKKTPPSEPATEDMSDFYISSTPSATTRIRSKRYPQRPSNLRIRGNSRSNTAGEKTPSPGTLVPEWPDDQEVMVPTPRASAFEPSSASPASSPRSPRRLGKLSVDVQEGRVRKNSTEGPPRIRKISTESKDARRKRESAADEGDDEGYDDLLSAYESDASKS